MSVVEWPYDVALAGNTVPCVLCGKRVPLKRATVGCDGPEGEQLFACNVHHGGYHDHICSWALATERSPGALPPPASAALNARSTAHASVASNALSNTPVPATARITKTTPEMPPRRHFIEHRTMAENVRVPGDLAEHLYARHVVGPAVVIDERPEGLVSPLRKQWLQLMRRVQRERARTLDARLILALTNQIISMQQLTFTAKTPRAPYGQTVLMISPEEIGRVPSACRTVYVLAALPLQATQTLQTRLNDHSLVVFYVREPSGPGVLLE